MDGLILALLALLSLPATQGVALDWESQWAGWTRVERETLEAGGEAHLVEALLSDGRELEGSRAQHLLVELLGASHQGLDPTPHQTALASELVGATEWPLGERASWLVAANLKPGRARVEATLFALEQSPQLEREDLLVAWRVGVDEARSLRLAEGAVPVQRQLHNRYLSGWSAVDLALSLGWLGSPEADSVLLGQIERDRAQGLPTGDLWSRRAIAELGWGNASSGLDYLGRALVRDSSDAALVLARLEYQMGRRRTARALWRALLFVEEPSAWTLRGWGLTQIPEAHVPLGTASDLSPTPMEKL